MNTGDTPQVDELLAGFKDRPEVMGSLSTENVGDLAAGVSAGANVYELMLFLESRPRSARRSLRGSPPKPRSSATARH